MTTITMEKHILKRLDALEDFAKELRAALAAPATAPAQPAWHDAPTCAGLWVNMMSGRLIVITEETLEAWQNAAVRWYGPISPDGGQS